MACDLTLSDPEAKVGQREFTFFLCSTGAWNKFTAWASSVPSAGEKLLELCENGTVTGTYALSDDLFSLIELSPRADPGVEATMERLAGLVGVGTATETVTVSGSE